MNTDAYNKKWHEDERFWELSFPIMFNKERLDNGTKEAHQIVDLLGILPGAAILDLGCGPGRHSVAFNKMGFTAVGVDPIEFFLRKAKELQTIEKTAVEFLKGDTRTFRRPDSFDAVISAFTSFGYFENPKEDLRSVENMFISLKKNGKIFVDVMSREILKRIFLPKSQNCEGTTCLTVERSVNADWSWIQNRQTITTPHSVDTFTVSHRLYSSTELCDLLQSAGFQDIKLFGDLNGIPYDQKAKRLIVLGVKK